MLYVKTNLNWIEVRTRLYAFPCKPPYFISFLLCRSFDFVGHGWLLSRARSRVIVRCTATSLLGGRFVRNHKVKSHLLD
ncbi:hypothetical protein KC348_g11 [Hortaea werneckii]|nr:hypothetical protein KC348_g11 [Hortaea werneckii]